MNMTDKQMNGTPILLSLLLLILLTACGTLEFGVERETPAASAILTSNEIVATSDPLLSAERLKVDALLTLLGEAFEAGDSTALVALFEEDAADYHALSDRKMLFNLHRIGGVKNISFVSSTAGVTDGMLHLGLVTTTAQYAISFEGIDEPYTYPIIIQIERLNDRWRVARFLIGDVPFMTLEIGNAYESKHFLLFANDGTDDVAEQFLRDAEAEYDKLLALGLPAIQRLPVTLHDNDSLSFETIEEAQLQLYNDISLFYDPFQRTIDASLSRNFEALVYARPYRLLVEEATDSERLTAVRRMLFAAMVTAETPSFMPIWLREGMRFQFDTSLSPTARQWLTTSPSYDEVDLQTLSRIGYNEWIGGEGEYRNEDESFYTRIVGDKVVYSAEVVSYLVEQFGLDAVLDFYFSFNQISVEEMMNQQPNATDFTIRPHKVYELTEELLEEHFGLTLAELEIHVPTKLLLMSGHNHG